MVFAPQFWHLSTSKGRWQKTFVGNWIEKGGKEEITTQNYCVPELNKKLIAA